MSGFSGIFPEYVLCCGLPNHKSVNSRDEWLHGWVWRIELAPLILVFNLVEKKLLCDIIQIWKLHESSCNKIWLVKFLNASRTYLFIMLFDFFLLILAKKWFFSCHNFNHGLRSNYSNAVRITHWKQIRQELMEIHNLKYNVITTSDKTKFECT